MKQFEVACMVRIWIVSVFAVLLAILLAGCERDVDPVPVSRVPPGQVDDIGLPDACSLVTGADASALFGQPAAPDDGPIGATMVDQCLWSWDTDTSGQLLQFQVWEPLAYSVPEDGESLDLGEGGYVRKHPIAGVDVAWRQGGYMFSLTFSTIGPGAPKATDRAEAVLDLARRVADRL